MNRRHVVAIAFLGIAACTTSGPETPVTGAVAEASVMTSNPTAAEGSIEQVGVPEEPMEATIAYEDELICKKEKLTGSRIPKRVCMTRAEREKIQSGSQDFVDAAKRSPGSNPQN
jgi:hypothetical protein